MAKWNGCPGCGITISGVPDYCSNCGEPWSIQCPNCGAPAERRGVTRGKREQVALEVGKPRATSWRHSR
jgi:predicted amidophosphoribosyltransferase